MAAFVPICPGLSRFVLAASFDIPDFCDRNGHFDFTKGVGPGSERVEAIHAVPILEGLHPEWKGPKVSEPGGEEMEVGMQGRMSIDERARLRRPPAVEIPKNLRQRTTSLCIGDWRRPPITFYWTPVWALFMVFYCGREGISPALERGRNKGISSFAIISKCRVRSSRGQLMLNTMCLAPASTYSLRRSAQASTGPSRQ